MKNIIEQLLPKMDCQNCQWHHENWRDGGFCYMFRVQPPGDKCGQMQPLQLKVDAKNESN